MSAKRDAFREPSPVQEGQGEEPPGEKDDEFDEEPPGLGLLEVPEIPRNLLRDDDRIRTRWIHRAFFCAFVLALLWGIDDFRKRPTAGGWLFNGFILITMAFTVSAAVAFLIGFLFTFRRQETAGEKWVRQRKRRKARRKQCSPPAAQLSEELAEDPPADPRIQKGNSP